jgi:hypothetical protein
MPEKRGRAVPQARPPKSQTSSLNLSEQAFAFWFLHGYAFGLRIEGVFASAGVAPGFFHQKTL